MGSRPSKMGEARPNEIWAASPGGCTNKTIMYRIIFEHHPKTDQENAFIAQWKKGSDIIQSYPGALGTKLFHKIGEQSTLYAMAEWESKSARNLAMNEINKLPNAEEILHGHEVFLDSHVNLGEFELIAESNPK